MFISFLIRQTDVYSMIETCQHYVYNNREETQKKENEWLMSPKYHPLMFLHVYLLERKESS